MYLKNVFLLLFLLLILSACNDDFPINSEWKDITIVYGLLNASDTVQYIKINKAFLGEGDVYAMAREADSIQYSQELDVRLIEYRIIDATVNPYLEFNWEPTSRDAIILTRTNEIPKNEKDIHGNPGIFSTELNYIYKTTESVSNRFKYKLLIKNPLNGKEVWSETYMIYDMRITNPSPFVDNKLNMANELNAYTTSWESAVYGKVYQPAIRFNYYEVKDGDTTLNNIIIKYNSQVSSVIRNPSPGESGLVMDQIIGGIQFYKSIVNKIEPNMGVLRVIRDIDFIYYVGGQNFFTYMNVSEAQVNYGQAAPEFSNIKNGKGMFDSRFKIEVGGKELTVPSIDSLANGRFTKHLGFANYSIP